MIQDATLHTQVSAIAPQIKKPGGRTGSRERLAEAEAAARRWVRCGTLTSFSSRPPPPPRSISRGPALAPGARGGGASSETTCDWPQGPGGGAIPGENCARARLRVQTQPGA